MDLNTGVLPRLVFPSLLSSFFLSPPSRSLPLVLSIYDHSTKVWISNMRSIPRKIFYIHLQVRLSAEKSGRHRRWENNRTVLQKSIESLHSFPSKSPLRTSRLFRVKECYRSKSKVSKIKQSPTNLSISPVRFYSIRFVTLYDVINAANVEPPSGM